MSGFYTNLVGPHWNEIDKIHYGPAASLNEGASNDGILLGRYVLVKYTKNVYSQEEISKIIEEGSNKDWLDCYEIDEEICDGMVYKKVYDDETNTICYKPICLLGSITFLGGLSQEMVEGLINTAVDEAKINWKEF